MNHSNSPSSDSNLELLLESFRSGLELLVNYAAEEGLRLQPYRDRSLPNFRNLLPREREELVQKFETYSSLMKELKSEGAHLFQNLQTVWRALHRLGLTPPEDLFAALEEGDIVEIYSLQGRQLFRSLNFFAISTYTLEELHTLPWYDLWARDDARQALANEVVGKFVAGEIQETARLQFGEHEVSEKRSELRRTNVCASRFLSPLRDRSGQMTAFLHAFIVTDSWDQPAS